MASASAQVEALPTASHDTGHTLRDHETCGSHEPHTDVTADYKYDRQSVVNQCQTHSSKPKVPTVLQQY